MSLILLPLCSFNRVLGQSIDQLIHSQVQRKYSIKIGRVKLDDNLVLRSGGKNGRTTPLTDELTAAGERHI
jgi:hypothetical protein